MINTFKFTNHLEIVTRLSKKFKKKEFNPDTVHDWCAEAENDILREHEYFTKFIKIKLEIKNKINVKLPCNIHSVIDVYFEHGSRPAFHQNGALIYLKQPSNEEYLYIDYKGTPVDPITGDVLILRGHELFCEWSCIKNSHLEDYLNGDIDGQRWSVIDEEYERACNIATQDLRYYSRADFELMNIVNGNMLPMIGRVPQYKEGV